MDYSINKTELARRYGWSLNFFMRRINTTPGLLDELKQDNYNLYQRVFTPNQVKIIYKCFGNPEEMP